MSFFKITAFPPSSFSLSSSLSLSLPLTRSLWSFHFSKHRSVSWIYSAGFEEHVETVVQFELNLFLRFLLHSNYMHLLISKLYLPLQLFKLMMLTKYLIQIDATVKSAVCSVPFIQCF